MFTPWRNMSVQCPPRTKNTERSLLCHVCLSMPQDEMRLVTGSITTHLSDSSGNRQRNSKYGHQYTPPFCPCYPLSLLGAARPPFSSSDAGPGAVAVAGRVVMSGFGSGTDAWVVFDGDCRTLQSAEERWRWAPGAWDIWEARPPQYITSIFTQKSPSPFDAFIHRTPCTPPEPPHSPSSSQSCHPFIGTGFGKW